MAGEVGGGMVVEPDDAGDAAGAVVDEEFKEVGFPLPADDNADGLSAGDEAAVKVEGEGVGVGDLGEGEEVRCQELDVCGGKGVHGSAYCYFYVCFYRWDLGVEEEGNSIQIKESEPAS